MTGMLELELSNAAHNSTLNDLRRVVAMSGLTLGVHDRISEELDRLSDDKMRKAL